MSELTPHSRAGGAADASFVRSRASAQAPGWRDLAPPRTFREQQDPFRRLEVLCRLTAGFAHDLNNMLAVIMGSAETLSRGRADSTEQQRLGAASLQAAARAADTVRQLTAIAESPRLTPERLDCRTLFAFVGPLLERSLRSDTELIITAPTERLCCTVDGAELEAALLTLCFDVRDAMPEGGVMWVCAAPVTVALDAGPEEPAPGDYVLFTVRSTTGPALGTTVSGARSAVSSTTARTSCRRSAISGATRSSIRERTTPQPRARTTLLRRRRVDRTL